jgi:hypothetical protein
VEELAPFKILEQFTVPELFTVVPAATVTNPFQFIVEPEAMTVLPFIAIVPAIVMADEPPIVVAFEMVTAPEPVLLNVPEFEIPPAKTNGELLAVLIEPPEFTENRPVNVFVPELLLSAIVPETVVVPPAVKLLPVMVKVRPALIVRFLILTFTFA